MLTHGSAGNHTETFHQFSSRRGTGEGGGHCWGVGRPPFNQHPLYQHSTPSPPSLPPSILLFLSLSLLLLLRTIPLSPVTDCVLQDEAPHPLPPTAISELHPRAACLAWERGWKRAGGVSNTCKWWTFTQLSTKFYSLRLRHTVFVFVYTGCSFTQPQENLACTAEQAVPFKTLRFVDRPIYS